MTKTKVLIASNSPLFSDILSDALSQAEYEVILSNDDQEVVAHLHDRTVALCFLRDTLPNGLAICEHFSRHAEPKAAIPIVVYSPRSTLEKAALERGAAGFLKVPCLPDEVLSLADNWVKLTRYSTPAPALPSPPLDTAAETKGQATETTATKEADDAAPAQPFRILLVDDSKLIHTAIGAIIRKGGFQLIEAYDGLEGFQKALNEMPDLIVSDIDMPHMNGYEMCKMVKEAPATQHIPVLILSARSAGIDIDKGFDAGANDFMTKPVGANELLSRIELMLEHKEHQPREKILVVDDSKLNRNFVSQGLAQQGFQVVTAANGKEALELAIQQEPDLVITDLEMPAMNGRDFCRELKKLEHFNDIPVIMLTASGSELDQAKGKHAGVDVYLSKPFSPDKLVVLVEKLAAERRLLRERATMQQYISAIERAHQELAERSQELAQANEEIQVLNQQLKAENLRMGAELDVTRRLQQMVLPTRDELATVDELDIAGYMEPADEVGGDYFDVLCQDGAVKIGIGDVTDHGLESGVVMLMTQAAVRTLLTSGEQDPVRFLDVLNRTVYGNVQRMRTDRNLTLALIDYEHGRVRLSGQHEELILIRQDGAVELVDTNDLGFPIGLFDEAADFFNHTTLHLAPGDGFVLYTDGVTEAENAAGEQYGLTRLCEVAKDHWGENAETIKEAVIADLRRYIGDHEVYDDITLLVAKQKAVPQ